MEINELYELFQQSGKISTDSRSVEPGSLFFALRGDRFDGNRYAGAALDQGAAYAIVDNAEVVEAGKNFILVEDVLLTLQQLARFHRRKFHIPVIAITGSNGKTTTKELVSAVLATHYPTHFTRGNLNNHIGVALTLLAMSDQTEVAVIEMGANAQGEIAALCQIAEPTHGVITNIGKAHLEGFGGLEGVKRGKSELYRYLETHRGTVFVNMDEPFLEDLSQGISKRILYKVASEIQAEAYPISVKLSQAAPFLEVVVLDESGQEVRIKSHLIGHYNLNNLLTAIALGKYFKVPVQRIKSAIEAYIPRMNRSQLMQQGSNTFILDAYNANPTSMEAALRNFAAMGARPKVALLGAMFELGLESAVEHTRIAKLAAQLGLEQVVLIGSGFAAAAEAERLLFFEDVAALRDWFWSQSWENTHFLLKGSRGMQLEKLFERKGQS